MDYGTFSPGDEFDITFLDDGTGPWHAYVDDFATVLVLTEIGGPPTSIFWHNVIQAIAVIEAIIIAVCVISLIIYAKKFGFPPGPIPGPPSRD